MSQFKIGPALPALGAAALFGASAPIIKYWLSGIAPVPLAALLYLGSGIGLVALRLAMSLSGGGADEARLRRSDAPPMIGVILAGGVAAPILLVASLKVTPAASASLLLNFEAAATAILAAALFREAVGGRVWAAVGVMTVACAALAWQPGGQIGMSLGALGILGACALWGLDNNLTQRLSAKDPVTVVIFKDVGAGLFSTILGLSLGQPFPALGLMAGAAVVGFFCYGLSTVLFVRSLRGLGAARTSAIYGVAPFFGATLSLVAFAEAPAVTFLLALPLMALGTYLLIGERHSHYHVHADLMHEHRPEVDVQHPAQSLTGEGVTAHVHSETGHTHEHAPDIHHRHSHDQNATSTDQTPD